MTPARFIAGPGKLWLYLRIILAIPFHYARKPSAFASPAAYCRFLARALRLLLAFRHNKAVRTARGVKLHLYLPAYPSPAFYYALESKLLRPEPGPTTIVFSMTKACAYRCPHCYQRRDAGDDLDEERLLRTAGSVRDAGVAFFDIEGGEPFLRYSRLLNLVRALDARCEIWVNSTGDRMEPARLDELRDAGVFGFMVSVHHPDPAEHDAFTGVPGSFDKAAALVRAARGRGLAVALNSVLSEAAVRAGRLAGLMDLARRWDVDFVQLIHPKPCGSWLEARAGMQTDPELLARLRREHVLYNSRARPDHPSLAAQVFEEGREVLGCTAGAVDRFYVGASGDVQPCEFLNLSFGNVTEEPFATILKRMRAVFREPCCDWLCCTQAEAIRKLAEENGLTRLPLPWPVTRQLVERWSRGEPTPLYRKLGLYK
jgi:MoaA/NifB/PqqE/SkfB family radical SAM enzyme